jgi:hypothetical protein
MLWGAITGIISLAKSVMGYAEKKLDTNLEGFKTAAGIDNVAYQSWLNAVVAVNGQKLAANAWWGAKAIIFMAGVPAALQFASIMLDSFPFPYLWLAVSDWWIPYPYLGAHVVGAWGVPKPPPPYDGYQRDILLSFFIIMPAMPLVSAISQWLGRK